MRHANRPSFVTPLFVILSVLMPAAGFAQRVFAYTEPSPCTTVFKPNSGFTFHGGGAFAITWYIPSSQYGPVTYIGLPNPATSDDRTKKWTNPSANVTCFTDWYYLLPTINMDAYYHWEINYYGGTVTSINGTGDGSGGGGTGGGESLRLCSTTRTDYYWYYPDTGQVEYRYSDSSTSCETMY